MTDEIEIRQLTEADAAAYRALRLRALRDAPASFIVTYEEDAARPLETTAARLCPQPGGSFTLGAFVGDALIGNATLRVAESRKERHRAEVFAVYVAPEARRRGVARRLLREIIARTGAVPGVEQIRISVVTENIAARALYHALGFVPYGVEPRALKDGDRYYDEEWMLLLLDRADG